MQPGSNSHSYHWLRTGDEAFPAMVAAIQAAHDSVRLETYTYAGDELGRKFLDALVVARRRGVRVQVLVDAFGSSTLPQDFWQPLVGTGGEVRWFNPMLLKRFGFRDHRKMLVCDSQTAFIGGFNITSEYVGDGIASGWCDIGLRLECPLAADFAIAFDEMFARADFQHKPFTRLRKTGAKRGVSGADAELLLSGPGRGHNPFKSRLHQDLKKARLVQIISAYFLPTWRIRRDLARIARHGGKVQLMLPAKSDVLLSQLATQSLYRRLMRSGVEIYEYQPQILHAKLIIVDGVAYAGSSNLDPRSLFINYEVMVRCTKTSAVAEAAEVFQEKLAHCRRIQLDAWRASRTWWQRLRDRWAYFILVRMDPVFARWQYRHMQE